MKLPEHFRFILFDFEFTIFDNGFNLTVVILGIGAELNLEVIEDKE